jgi:hypothetical protein
MTIPPVIDTESALQDLVSSCHGAIYAYGVVAAQLTQSENALDAIARYRIKRDQLIELCVKLGITPAPARAAYELPAPVKDDVSAKVAAALLEERACAHWATALSYLPKAASRSESKFLQTCALSSFKWSGVIKAFSSA